MALPLLIIGAIALSGLTAIFIALLSWSYIVDWFQNRAAIKDEETVAFTLKQKLDSGNVKVIHGFFNTQAGKIVDGQQVEAEKLDSEMEEIFGDEEIVVLG